MGIGFPIPAAAFWKTGGANGVPKRNPHKLKKRIPTTKEQQAIFRNTHETIVEASCILPPARASMARKTISVVQSTKAIREIGQAKKRIAELDRIFKRIYEDDINGTISHEKFLKLSVEYEAEQRELTEMVNAVQREVDTYEQDKNDFNSFAAVIRKYVGITQLTPTIVNEFIKKIVVHAPKKIDGKRFQKVDIVFNFVGKIHFPTEPQTKTKDTEKQEKTA